MKIVLIMAAILGLIRIFGVTDIAFQASAHLFMGGLFGAWWIDKKKTWLILLFVAMTVLELVCFFGGTVHLFK